MPSWDILPARRYTLYWLTSVPGTFLRWIPSYRAILIWTLWIDYTFIVLSLLLAWYTSHGWASDNEEWPYRTSRWWVYGDRQVLLLWRLQSISFPWWCRFRSKVRSFPRVWEPPDRSLRLKLLRQGPTSVLKFVNIIILIILNWHIGS